MIVTMIFIRHKYNPIFIRRSFGALLSDYTYYTPAISHDKFNSRFGIICANARVFIRFSLNIS